jgi:two-component system phosphate regulon sensor histidine kinase PhoR
MSTTTVQLKSNAQPLLSQGTWPAPVADHQAANELLELLLHDVRSPLAAINGSAQLLRRRAAGNRLEIAALMGGLQRIEAAATRIEGLLDELARLPASGVERGATSQRQATDLVQLAQHVALASEAAGLGKCRVVVLSGVQELVGWWNAAQVERALANLIDNGLKYNRDHSPVVVTVQQAEAWAVISVADQGVGIPTAELTRVYERGYRASNVDRQFRGTGLGLAGVHQMVAEHGGTIELESQVGVGTTVTLRLPLEPLDPVYGGRPEDRPTSCCSCSGHWTG